MLSSEHETEPKLTYAQGSEQAPETLVGRALSLQRHRASTQPYQHLDLTRGALSGRFRESQIDIASPIPDQLEGQSTSCEVDLTARQNLDPTM
jgi:hypothetical protein